MIELKWPFDREQVLKLKAGDDVLISGTIYAARDAAHKKLVELLDRGEALPIDVKDQFIYYVGPCPEKPGQVIGSAGPTTSGRMDAYAPRLMKLGMLGMIGKGERTKEVKESMVDNGAVYFGAVGGAGALISKCIVKQEIIAFDELGPEALRKLEVEKMPVTVLIDSRANNLYEIGKENFKKDF